MERKWKQCSSQSNITWANNGVHRTVRSAAFWISCRAHWVIQWRSNWNMRVCEQVLAVQCRRWSHFTKGLLAMIDTCCLGRSHSLGTPPNCTSIFSRRILSCQESKLTIWSRGKNPKPLYLAEVESKPVSSRPGLYGLKCLGKHLKQHKLSDEEWKYIMDYHCMLMILFLVPSAYFTKWLQVDISKVRDMSYQNYTLQEFESRLLANYQP